MEAPYLAEGPLEYYPGSPTNYIPHVTHHAPPPPHYGPVPHNEGPLPSYQGLPPPHYGPVPHNQEPFPSYQGLPPPHYGPVPHNQEPLPTQQSFLSPHSNYRHNGGVVPDVPYPYQEDRWPDEEEEEEVEEEEEDDFLPYNSLGEALEELDIQLPRLAVTAPSSVIPPKGAGRCHLPNLGSSSYMNAILQCLYHTPTFPGCLAQVCKAVEEGQKQKSSVARALTFLMTKMDDVKLMKKGMLAYFKGVCGLRDETFAGVEQQEAHDLLAGLLLWLHQDLAGGDKQDCACTKAALSKHLINSTVRHNNLPPGYTIYTGDNHNNTSYHHHHPLSSSPSKLNDAEGGRERKVCQKCGVAYQRRSFVSDMFEGIHQLDVICARVGIILHTEYERFTSLSIPLTTPGEVTLEEALQQHYGMDMVMWDCEYCSKSHLCHRQIRVLYSPLVLVIHLGRPAKKHSARMQDVKFPMDDLTLGDHMILGRKSRSRCHKYSLYAMCNLRGSHHTAVCKANRDQRQQGHWFLFDDDKVSKISHFKDTKEAHILFYRSPIVEMMPEAEL